MNLIFLTYINRSGSTYLANLFSKSENILVCPEAEVILNEFLTEPDKPFLINNQIEKRLTKYFKEDKKLKYWNLPANKFDYISKASTNLEAFVSILESYRDFNKPKAETLLFKAERLIDLYGFLSRQQKEKYKIQFLVIVRDCRAVYASQKNTKLPGSTRIMSNNPLKTAFQWNNQISKSIYFKEQGELIMIHYEQLINNLNQAFVQLLEQISINGLKFSSSSGDLFERIPETHREIHQNILEAPIKSKCDNWKNELTKEEIYIIQKISGSYLSLAGYKLVKRKVNIMKVYAKIFYYYITFIAVRIIKKIIFRIKSLIKS